METQASATTTATITPVTVTSRRDVDVFVFGLFVVFGMGSWLTINGIYSELPAIVSQVPEGWAISTQLGVAIQAANLGPIILYLARRRWPQMRVRAAITTVLITGAVSMTALAFLWNVRTGGGDGGDGGDGGGNRHSIWLLFLTFAAAAADCSSSVLFYPFAGTFPAVYMIALNVGEACSSLVPGLLAWIQAGGPGGTDVNYSPGLFFGLIAGLMATSLFAFGCLCHSTRARAVAAIANNRSTGNGNSTGCTDNSGGPCAGGGRRHRRRGGRKKPRSADREYLLADDDYHQLQQQQQQQQQHNQNYRNHHHHRHAKDLLVEEGRENENGLVSHSVVITAGHDGVEYSPVTVQTHEGKEEEEEEEENTPSSEISSAGTTSSIGMSGSSSSAGSTGRCCGGGGGGGGTSAFATPRGWWRYNQGSLAALAVLSLLRNGNASIMTYACMPYGTGTYHAAVSSTMFLAPLGALVCLWPRMRLSQRWLLRLTPAWCVPPLYLAALALSSPEPPFMADGLGAALVITAAAVGSLSLSYVQTLLTFGVQRDTEREEASEGHAEAALFWTGAMLQAGAFLGALFWFILSETGVVHS